MTRVVVDIETIGHDFHSLDAKSQEYLMKYGETPKEKEKLKKKLGLYPLTGEIVAIGMLNPDTMKGCVLFQNSGEKTKNEEKGIVFESGNEKEMLELFWERVRTYGQVITFNGRRFDAPYLIIRSAIHKVTPSRNLMRYRYDYKDHCDLLDQLTFYGAMRKYNLDFYAKSFGLVSSKEEGIDGSMVSDLFKQGRYLDIARYCVRDLLTTKELYDVWDKFIRIEENG